MLSAIKELYVEGLPESSLQIAAHRSGLIHTSTYSEPLVVDKVLFDTGAIHGSYISKHFVQLHRKELFHHLHPCFATVTFADNRTSARIDEEAELTISFTYPGFNDTHVVTGTIRCYVLDTSGPDLIIGLPAILQHFYVLHQSMLEMAVKQLDNNQNNSELSSLTLPRGQINSGLSTDSIKPWSNVLDVSAPEDDLTVLPSSFTSALYFLDKTHDEAVQDYFNLFDTHVSLEFSANTDILRLLRTKGIDVFIPRNWEGIRGLEPFELQWLPGMPSSMRPRPRPVNPRLYDNALKEFNRLRQYFYQESSSSIASCLVIAPKATHPFIRFCGDYVSINKYIEVGHYPIPHVLRSLEKISKYSVFLDFDMANAFHQVRLGPETSRRLSIQTPWGQFQPLFMPEGIGPASGKLQQVVSSVFAGFEDWTICIFDNLLVLANDFQDAYNKVDKILTRCLERNVYLKFSKTWLGFDSANFFGYVCRKGSFELANDRKQALADIPFPTTVKKMQSFLGTALFFQPFVPHYASLVAPLHDMTHQTFDWREDRWATDYKRVFQTVKKALQHSLSIYYPDYSLEWILRTDASMAGVGAVLLQVYIPADADAEPQLQPIGFASKKFSDAATRWSTLEQEAYAVFFGVQHFSYFLYCKSFILETDHANLQWIEVSTVPKVVRWRVLLQSFVFRLRHIAGRLNSLADFLSRMHEPDPPSSITDSSVTPISTTVAALHAPHLPPATHEEESVVIPAHNSLEEMLQSVHGGVMGHMGTRRTWHMLNEFYPGHHIPYRFVDDFVSSCPLCQKTRLKMESSLKPITRFLKPPHRRSIVGVDTLTVTPADKDGNELLIVIVNHFTKLTGIYPAKSHTALTAAESLLKYFTTYGLVDSLISDPGTEYSNELVSHLTTWLGIRHVFSLVDRHESNGVERTNAEILRHLRSLVFDHRVLSTWSSPTTLCLVQFMINSATHSETGYSPFEATFGSADTKYFILPPPGEEGGSSALPLNQYVLTLNENLHLLQELSLKHQARLVEERKAASDVSPTSQNRFAAGDLVLFRLDPLRPLPTKLSPKYIGPYEVLNQESNDVTCRHVNLGHVKVFHVEKLKLFHGTMDQARKIALLDQDQYLIAEIRAYRGNPEVRTTMEFLVLFEDQSLIWLPWSRDLFSSVPYETFCRSRTELDPLIFEAKVAQQLSAQLNRMAITAVQPGDKVLVDIRSYGATWYGTLSLPDLHLVTYAVPYTYTRWANKGKTKISAICPLFKETFPRLDHTFVKRYGNKVRPSDFPTPVVVLDEEILRQYPQVLSAVSVSHLLA